MKAKKAVKRLGKVESLLSNVIDQYVPSVDSVRELLDSAKASVVRAMEAVSLQSSTGAPKKPPVKALDKQIIMLPPTPITMKVTWSLPMFR